MGEYPSIRQERILQWLQEHQSLSIEALAERLDVSVMTVHRDLNELVRTGAVEKVRGGVRLATQSIHGIPVNACVVCGGGTSERSSFLVTRADGVLQSACCPHCGLLMNGMETAPTVLAREYLYGRMVNARRARYVIVSSVTLCCQPSVLCFATLTDAQKFQRGFGGHVMDFEEARAALADAHGTCGGHESHS